MLCLSIDKNGFVIKLMNGYKIIPPYKILPGGNKSYAADFLNITINTVNYITGQVNRWLCLASNL